MQTNAQPSDLGAKDLVKFERMAFISDRGVPSSKFGIVLVTELHAELSDLSGGFRNKYRVEYRGVRSVQGFNY